MHDTCFKWVQSVVKQIDLTGLSVLEVGSYNVNGSVRPLFKEAKNYVGIDNREGPGVDRVMDASLLNFHGPMFDIVISTEMLEHDPAFWISMREMGRVLKPQGHLIITARGNGFPLHDYPGDYWRFMPQSFELLFQIAGCEVLQITPDHKSSPGVFGWGRKR